MRTDIEFEARNEPGEAWSVWAFEPCWKDDPYESANTELCLANSLTKHDAVTLVKSLERKLNADVV